MITQFNSIIELFIDLFRMGIVYSFVDDEASDGGTDQSRDVIESGGDADDQTGVLRCQVEKIDPVTLQSIGQLVGPQPIEMLHRCTHVKHEQPDTASVMTMHVNEATNESM